MPENKRISVSFTRTFNLGNYESVKIGASASQDVTESNESEIYQTLYDEVMGEVFSVAEDIVPDYQNE